MGTRLLQQLSRRLMHPDEGIDNDACIITNNERKQFLLWRENLSIGWINFTVYVFLGNFQPKYFHSVIKSQHLMNTSLIMKKLFQNEIFLFIFLIDLEERKFFFSPSFYIFYFKYLIFLSLIFDFLTFKISNRLFSYLPYNF